MRIFFLCIKKRGGEEQKGQASQRKMLRSKPNCFFYLLTKGRAPNITSSGPMSPFITRNLRSEESIFPEARNETEQSHNLTIVSLQGPFHQTHFHLQNFSASSSRVKEDDSLYINRIIVHPPILSSDILWELTVCQPLQVMGIKTYKKNCFYFQAY